MSSTASESDVIATLSADRRHSSLRRIGRVLRAASQAEPGKKSGMTQLASWGLGRSAHTPLASGIGSGPIVLDETAIGVRCLWWPAALGSLQDRRPGSEIRSEIAPYSGLGFAARDAWPWTRIRRWPSAQSAASRRDSFAPLMFCRSSTSGRVPWRKGRERAKSPWRQARSSEKGYSGCFLARHFPKFLYHKRAAGLACAVGCSWDGAIVSEEFLNVAEWIRGRSERFHR